MRGHIDIVRLLIEHGSNVNARAKNDYTPLNIAYDSRDIDTITELLKCDNIEINEKIYKDLIALLHDHPHQLEEIVKRFNKCEYTDFSAIPNGDSQDLNKHLDTVNLLPDNHNTKTTFSDTIPIPALDWHENDS